MNYTRLFNSMFPGFFYKAYIKSMSEDNVFAELIMDLRRYTPKPVPYSFPDHVAFGEYRGKIETLKETVNQVDEDWTQFFSPQSRAFCAFDKETIVSFCILEDWGKQDGLRIGGPGCVGTVSAYRKKGIGLELVSHATNILIEEGFDISWIHFTHLWHWYEKLGYQTVLKWNCKGIIRE